MNIQSMVFGNMGQTSGTGVLFTRNPSTGEKKLYGEFLINAQVTFISLIFVLLPIAPLFLNVHIVKEGSVLSLSFSFINQGEDVVAGIRTPEDLDTMKDCMPEAYKELVENCEILERHYKDMMVFLCQSEISF